MQHQSKQIFNRISLLLLIFKMTQSCKISIRDDLDSQSPLLLDKRNEFIYPTSNILSFDQGTSFQVACPGSNMQLSGNDVIQSQLEVKCAGKFKIVDREIKFSQIKCRKPPQPIIEFPEGEKCGPGNQFDKFQVGFVLKSGFLTLMEGCYDRQVKNTLYTMHLVPKGISYSQVTERVSFKDATCKIQKESSNKLYQKSKQQRTINMLLKLHENSTEYITANQYLAKGHLTPNGDFVYNSQQRATFFCNNAVPQWQNNNNANWKKVENFVRDLASKSSDGLMVYTGTSGVSKLRDTPLHLFAENDVKGFPVPEFLWKIVRKPKESTGIAFLLWNNPFVGPKTTPCQSTCGDVNFKVGDASLAKGVIFCCSVNSDLRRKVGNIPNFVTG